MKNIADLMIFRTVTNSSVCLRILQEALDRFQSLFPKGPRLVVKEGGKELKEAFFLDAAAGEVIAKGGTPTSLFEAISWAEIALKGGYLPASLGLHSPMYPWRLIWLMGQETQLSPDILCPRLFRLGYNGVVSSDLSLLTSLRGFGLKGVYKFSCDEIADLSPFDLAWEENLSEKIKGLPALDGIFFESQFSSLSYRRHSKARDLLQSDLAVYELKAIERQLQGRCPLIYVLPYIFSVRVMTELSDEAGGNTLLAFSATSGVPWEVPLEVHLSPHPFWEVLRHSPDKKGTPLLPLINGGALGEGEGFWPLASMDLLERNFQGMGRHAFGGAIILTKSMPVPGSFLDGNLWVAGQGLKRGGEIDARAPRTLFERWCAAYHPELVGTDWLEQIGRLVSQLNILGRSLISSEEGRLVADCIMADLQRLKWQIRKGREESEKGEKGLPSFNDYWNFFVRDAKRLVTSFLQSRHLPFVYRWDKEDEEAAFWTKAASGGILGGGSSSGKVTLLEKPNSGEEGSVQRLIYDQVKGLDPFYSLYADDGSGCNNSLEF